MSNLSFRPRPIDVWRPLPIFVGELPDEAEGYNVTRGMPELPPEIVDSEGEAERAGGRRREPSSPPAPVPAPAHRSGALAGAPTPRGALPTGVIPVPQVVVVEDYDEQLLATRGAWLRPEQYVLHTMATPEELDAACEYDADDADHEAANAAGCSLELLEWAVDRFEKETDYHGAPPPPAELLRLVLAAAQERGRDDCTETVLQQLHSYWRTRRQQRNEVPLLYRLLPAPSPDDPSPYHAFRPRERAPQRKRAPIRNDLNALLKLRNMRWELDRGRALLSLVHQRERLKRQLARTRASLLDVRVLETRRRALAGEPELELDFAPAPRPAPPPRVPAAQSSDESELDEAELDELLGPALPPPPRQSAASSEWARPRVRQRAPTTPAAAASTPAAAAPSENEDYKRPWRVRVLPPDELPPAATAWANQMRLPLAPVPGMPHVRGRPRFARGGRVVWDRVALPPPADFDSTSSSDSSDLDDSSSSSGSDSSDANSAESSSSEEPLYAPAHAPAPAAFVRLSLARSAAVPLSPWALLPPPAEAPLTAPLRPRYPPVPLEPSQPQGTSWSEPMHSPGPLTSDAGWAADTSVPAHSEPVNGLAAAAAGTGDDDDDEVAFNPAPRRPPALPPDGTAMDAS